MDVLFYIGISAIIIMIWHFAFSNKPRDFDLLLQIGIFVIGGAIGYYMKSTETALFLSIIISLLFI